MLKNTLNVEGISVPVVCANTVIVGAGAAGMACAVRCVEFWRSRGITDGQDRVLVVTAGLGLGASRMSGSDKQTYYKMGTSPRVPDSAEDFAKALVAWVFQLEAELAAGQTVDIKLIAKDPEANQYYLRKAGATADYVIYKSTANALMKKAEDFKPKAGDEEDLPAKAARSARVS